MKILFIGSRLFDDVAWYLKENNITSIVTESNENAINLDLADKHYIVERGMDKPMEVAIKEDVDAVIPLIGIDPPLIDVGLMKEKLEEEMGIPVVASSHSTASLAYDKYKTKKFLDQNGIKTPNYRKYTIGEDLLDELPLVLKSPAGQGGSGVKIALTKDDVDEFLLNNDEVFIEDYVEGFEASIEVLRWKNQSVALTPVYKGNTTLKGTHPLAKIKKAPLTIEDEDNTQHNNYLRSLAEEIADLVALDGTMDIDILHSTKSDEDLIIELNTRPSGTRYMTAAATDVYPLCQLVDMATGKWDARRVKSAIKDYHAYEIPVGTFEHGGDISRKYFDKEDSYIVHGPENYQRITLRSKNMEVLNEMSNKLAGNYLNKNNIQLSL